MCNLCFFPACLPSFVLCLLMSWSWGAMEVTGLDWLHLHLWIFSSKDKYPLECCLSFLIVLSVCSPHYLFMYLVLYTLFCIERGNALCVWLSLVQYKLQFFVCCCCSVPGSLWAILAQEWLSELLCHGPSFKTGWVWVWCGGWVWSMEATCWSADLLGSGSGWLLECLLLSPNTNWSR